MRLLLAALLGAGASAMRPAGYSQMPTHLAPPLQRKYGLERSPLVVPTTTVLSPQITIGDVGHHPATNNFIVAIQGVLQARSGRPDRVATRDDALQLLAFVGAKIIVATRTGAWWKIRQRFLGIGSARAFSESDAQLFTSVALHVFCFETSIMGGSLPRHAAALSVLFMEALKDMFVIPRRGANGRPAHYQLTQLARDAGINAHHAILLATSLAVAHRPSLTRAIRYADAKGLGGNMVAACVFGVFTDSLALSGRLTSAIVGNPTAYARVGPPTLRLFRGVIQGTCRSNTRMKMVYRTGLFDMGIKVVNSALTLGAAGAVVRGASRWLRLPPMPRELLDVNWSDGPFGLSIAHYNKVYRTAQFALGCVLTDTYLNMGTYRLLRPIRRPTAAGGILAQMMRRLFYLIGPPGKFYDPDDEEEWDWLSLIYAMTGCIVLICAGKVYINDMDPDDREALRRCEDDPKITVTYVTDAIGTRVESVTFKPNTGLPVLDEIYGDLPVTRALLEAAGFEDMEALAHDLRALEDPTNDIAGNPGSAHRTLIRREAGVNDPFDERDI